MATQEYGKYILISTPYHDLGVEGWVPLACITWRERTEWREHRLKYIPGILDTADAAIDFGFTVARAKIDSETTKELKPND